MADPSRPRLQHHYPAGQKYGLVNIVGNKQHSRAILSPYVQKRILHMGAGKGIQCSEGLVQQKNLGIAQETSGNGYPL
ncbi:hypothetical protein D3C71_1343500 [compost metagenome]